MTEQSGNSLFLPGVPRKGLERIKHMSDVISPVRVAIILNFRSWRRFVCSMNDLGGGQFVPVAPDFHELISCQENADHGADQKHAIRIRRCHSR